MNLISLLLIFLVASSPTYARKQCSGIWAADAKSLYKGSNYAPEHIAAPNGKISVDAGNESLSLVNKNNSPLSLDVLINPPLMEILWAPDSRKFVINVSDGGIVGSWDTKYYSIDKNNRPTPYDIRHLIRPASNKLLKCEPGEEANIGAISWLNNGEELLIIVEAPPHSSCKNPGAIWGFRVSISDKKIIERISENRLRKKWGNALGCRFLIQ